MSKMSPNRFCNAGDSSTVYHYKRMITDIDDFKKDIKNR